ncbi:MAG: hypothetical protein H3C35_07040 [Bacteroidetes bacterium]|nr:hypothetical protein [Bacteroidota bacterium]
MHTHHLKYVRLTARVLSGMLFILWGSFFIDHLSWFMESSGAPPTHVWLMQGVHLLLLLGYLILFKWEYIGSFLLVLCSVVFFGIAAGVNAIPFVIVSTLPVLLLFYCWLKEGGKFRLKIVK